MKGYGRTNVLILSGALMVVTTLTVAKPIDNWNVEGEHGEIHVHGTMTEGSCRLDMLSAWQDISLGNMSLSELEKPGDVGKQVPFTIRLAGCIRKGGSITDPRVGTLVWDAAQPVVTARFAAVADADNPQLVKVNGVSGIGLRITDAQGHDIRLGDRGAPQFTAQGNNELAYNVQAERTRAELIPGTWRAVVNFALDYD